jgi:hypothetical protein
MPNPNPWKARLAKAAKHAPGDIDAFRRRTWALLNLAYDDCAQVDPDQRRRAILAYAQLAGVYARLLETSVLEALQARITTLEAQLLARSPHGQIHSRT